MEKFVTDLDKLLDEFENEDLSNSSAYISITSNTGCPAEISINQNTDNFQENSTDFNNLNCGEIIDSDKGSINIEYNKNSIEEIESHLNKEKLISNCTDNEVPENVTSMENQIPEIATTDSNVIVDRSGDGSAYSDTFSNLHVPPKKKLRPNSLFGLSSITTSENVENNFNQNQTISNACEISNQGSPDSSSVNTKIIKRHVPSNMTRPDENDIIVPNIQVNNENLVPIPEHISVIPQDIAKKSSQLTREEHNLTHTETIDSTSSAWQGIPIEELGKKEPTWIKDDLTNNCMQCHELFTMFRRRHHCRACGRLLCGKCCCWRIQLQFSNRFFPKDRVCAVCFQHLIRIEVAKKQNQSLTISNLQPQNSVLKVTQRPQSLAISPFYNSDNLSISDSSNNSSNQSKSVIFFDGIRPGGDLMETEKSRIITPTKYHSTQNKTVHCESRPVQMSRESSFLDQGDVKNFLPPSVIEYKQKLVINSNSENFAQQTRIAENNPIILAITRNLHIHLEIIQLTYCTCTINHTHTNNVQHGCEYDSIECWYFASIGLETIGCEEVVIILKKISNENSPPIEIFQYYFQIYQRSYTNETKNDGLEMTLELFNEKNTNLKDWAGILHIRPSFQCLDKLPLPNSSFLIGILVHRWELAWAKILPLRLVLALGNQSRFYPCSIISDRFRSSVYVEISQTILQIISPVFMFPNNLEQGCIDPNFLPSVPGMWIHLLPSQESIIQIPKVSYHTILDILSYRPGDLNTLALVACFSREADSHLVCCQNEDSCKYYSGAINIQHTEPTVTGATMIIFVSCENNIEHGAAIVEDVLVIRLSSMQLGCVINSLKTMSNLILQWDNIATASRSFIKIVWTDSHQFADMTCVERPSLVTDETIQAAFLNTSSFEDGTIKSHRVPSNLQIFTSNDNHHQNNHKTTKNNNYNIENNLKIVWTRFHFFVSGNVFSDSFNEEPVDVEDLIRKAAICFCQTLYGYVDILREMGLVNINLRVTMNSETVTVMTGCSKKFLYSALTPDQSPSDEPDSNPNSYISSKMGNSRKFHSLSLCKLPDICLESLNEVFVPFLYSLVAQIRTGTITTELEFHIID